MMRWQSSGSISGDSRGLTSRVTFLAVAVWTAALAASLAFSVYGNHREVLTLATAEARANLDKDLAYRLWATSHGGVYVPVDAETPPSPYLAHIPERDLVTPSGVQLTLMNPAYMLRQMITFYGDLYGVRGRITGLQVLNPTNTPDPWEVAALHRFEAGERQVSEVVESGGAPVLRVMRAMMMEEACLKCHAFTNIPVGGVRGGIGVEVPLAPYYAVVNSESRTDAIIHLLLWLTGLTAIVVFGRSLHRVAAQRDGALTILEESEARYRSIVETAQEGVWVLDSYGITLYANAVMAGMVGWRPDELVGRPLGDFIAGDPAVAAAILAGEAAGRRVEVRLRHRSQQMLDAVVAASHLHDIEGDRVLCMVSDISGLKRGEERLMGLVDELTASNAELERFAQVASHDLQEPVRTVVSFAQLLDRRSNGLDAQSREYLSYMVAGAHRMYDLVNDLLAYSRLSAEGAAFRPVDSAAAVAGALDNLRHAIEESGARIELGDLPVVLADVSQMTQLFQNLIGNAIKFRLPGRPPLITVTGVPGDGDGTGMVEFMVVDNGIGIDPAYFDDIFGIFRRLHGPDAFAGTGIGLATCKRIVDRHGGRIWVESEPGKGAVFHFTLPAALAVVPAPV